MVEETTTVKDHIVKLRIGTVAIIASVAVSSLIGAGIGYEKIQARLRHLDGKTDVYAERFDGLEARVSDNEKSIDNHYIEIMTKLSGIDSMLIDIKNSLR